MAELQRLREQVAMQQAALAAAEAAVREANAGRAAAEEALRKLVRHLRGGLRVCSAWVEQLCS